MCDPKLRTPGIERSSMQAAVEIRTSSACDVPGRRHPVHEEVALLEVRAAATGPSCGADRDAGDADRGDHARTPAAPFGRSAQRRARSACCSRRASGRLARCSSGALRSRIRAIAGVTVSATISEARTASAYEIASGWKNAPDRPPMKKTGSDRDDDDQRRVDDRAPHLERGLEDDRGRRATAARQAVLAEPADDVLDVDDGVVDDHPDRDHAARRGPSC